MTRKTATGAKRGVLTRHERSCVIWRRRGLGYAAIARKLRVTERSVDSALDRARQKGCDWRSRVPVDLDL